MRVYIGTFYLAGDPALGEHRSSSCGEFNMTPRRIQQQVEGWQWEVPQFADRGNLAQQVEFDTIRRFDSFAEVHEFMRSISTAHAWEGTVTFREDGPMPGTWTEFDIANCIITPPVMYPMGVSLRLHYSILGGAISPNRTGVWGARITEGDEERETEDGGIRVQEDEA
ncbi:hypothetical protein [Verrucomicrobium spinosum]|uniref:hypothetical protein n=1 Tax=Verrucomicrobium spinosum TaxID=2736 RepID=UPI0001746945|nr:hypothetical protein [Verrucomicrobium spinosum]